MHSSSIILALGLAVGAVEAGGAIHGTVRTREGQVLSGVIRWDHNENFWEDRLEAHRMPVARAKPKEGFRFSFFGLGLGDTGGDERMLSVPFGQLRSIESTGSTVRLTLKNGRTIEVLADAYDLGSSMRGIVVESAGDGRVELDWRALARVDFDSATTAEVDRQRLHGTVTTPAGEFRGFIVWDRDEALGSDVLDGEACGVDRDVRFSEIREIAPLGAAAEPPGALPPRSPAPVPAPPAAAKAAAAKAAAAGQPCQPSHGSRVLLKDGTVLLLEGTNDVDEGHRGVMVLTAGRHEVDIPWSQVRKVAFDAPPASAGYADFDGGRPLSGTVRTRDGATRRGTLVWDLDAAYGFEQLVGLSREIEYGLPFEAIRSIEPLGGSQAKVLLKAGGELALELVQGHEGFRGLKLLAADGSEQVLAWEQLRAVELD